MFDFIIAGGGLAGLSSAILLERLGYKIALLEKEKTFAMTGAGLCLPANALTALNQLGLADEIANAGFLTQHWDILTREGTLLNRIDLKSYFGKGVVFGAISRPDVQRVLVEQLNKTQCYFSDGVAEFSCLNDQVVIKTKSGKHLEANALIAADGIYSEVRQTQYPEITVNDIGVWAWRFLMDRPKKLDQPRYYIDSGFFLLLQPCSTTEMYVGIVAAYTPLPEDLKQNISMPWAILSHLLVRMPNIYQCFFSQAENAARHFHSAAIKHLSHIAWGKERVLIIGDAAHACPPALQQGGSLAFEDSLSLANALRHTPDFLKAKATFISKRQARVQYIFDQSTVLIKRLSEVKTEQSEEALRVRYEWLYKYPPENFEIWRELFS